MTKRSKPVYQVLETQAVIDEAWAAASMATTIANDSCMQAWSARNILHATEESERLAIDAAVEARSTARLTHAKAVCDQMAAANAHAAWSKAWAKARRL